MITPAVLGSIHLEVGGYEVPLFLYVGIVFVTSFIFLPMFLFRKWYAYRHRLKSNLITSEYEPPYDLTPAEFQYLFGGINNERVIAASIIHLVQRGYVHMRIKEGKKLLFAGPKAKDSSLTLWERMILSHIESSSKDVTAIEIMK